MSELTGGELLARALANEGVTFVFGLPCPEIDPLLAALDANGIRFVTIRHEAAADCADGRCDLPVSDESDLGLQPYPTPLPHHSLGQVDERLHVEQQPEPLHGGPAATAAHPRGRGA